MVGWGNGGLGTDVSAQILRSNSITSGAEACSEEELIDTVDLQFICNIAAGSVARYRLVQYHSRDIGVGCERYSQCRAG